MSPGLLVLFFLCIYVHLPSHTFTGEPVKPASRWRVSWADCAFFHCIHYLLTHSQEGLSSLQAGGLTPGLLVLFFLCIHAQLPSHTFTGGPVKPASRWRVSWAARAILPLHSRATTFSHTHRRACQACKQAACLKDCSSSSSSAFTHIYLLTHSQEGLSSLQAGSVSPGLLVLSLPLHSRTTTFSHIHRRACQACKQVACLLGCSSSTMAGRYIKHSYKFDRILAFSLSISICSPLYALLMTWATHRGLI